MYSLRNAAKHELGTILIGSRILVTDPCYLDDTETVKQMVKEGRGTVLAMAKPGEWKVGVYVSDEGHYGKRVSCLWAKHSSVGELFAPYHTRQVYVDSGQMMIADSVTTEERWEANDFEDEEPDISFSYATTP